MRRRLARADNCLRDRLTSQQRIRRRENYVRLDLAIGSPPPERGGSSVLRCPRLEKVERTILPPDGADGFAAWRCTAHELLVSDPGIQSHFAQNDIRVDLHRPGDIPVYRSGDLNCAAWAITAVVRHRAGGDRDRQRVV